MRNEVAFNKTKIVATIGPASRNKEMLTKLAKAGANVFRLNFSHGTHADHQATIDMIKELNKELGTNIATLQDLQGPKIRTNQIVNNEVTIERGQKLTITNDDDLIGDDKVISTTYKSLPTDVKVGDKILIDDGKLELKVLSSQGKDVVTEVVHGGVLKSRKGINLPNTKVSSPSLTEKDIIDLAYGLKQEVDWVALSFVRTAEDIHDIKRRIKAAGKDIKVVAKIEKPEALVNIDAIIEATDAVMVARGDLGVEVPSEQVPLEQKKMVRKCNIAGKPVIVATQMLESMTDSPVPTRAETNDVANAILDGADAVMLSAESASGQYPEEAVTCMSNIIRSVESSFDSLYYRNWKERDCDANDTLVKSAVTLADSINAKALVGTSKSGYTGVKLASHRPNVPIFIFTNNERLLGSLSLVWGVKAFYYNKNASIDDTFNDLEAILVKEGFLNKGDIYINTAAMPLHWDSKTNMIKINVVS